MDRIIEFYNFLAANENKRNELEKYLEENKPDNNKQLYELLINFAKQNEFNFTVEDIKEAEEKYREEAMNIDDLDLENLDMASGGGEGFGFVAGIAILGVGVGFTNEGGGASCFLPGWGSGASACAGSGAGASL